jgi:hypothetical protein
MLYTFAQNSRYATVCNPKSPQKKKMWRIMVNQLLYNQYVVLGE